MPDWNPRANDLFLKALDLPSAERPAFLAGECGDDAGLRRAVDTLLHAHEMAGDFLADPYVPDGTATFDARTHSHGVTTAPVGEAGQVIAGRYKLVERIGEGGMGSVWMADQTEPVKRKVAVKLIKAGLDSKQVLARFEAERQALALMDHPNIAKVLDGGVYDGRPYFVMELVKGVPITAFCDARKLTPQQRLELFVPVCQAIQHAHQKGVIHRDIKPANVLVALYDDRPVPKVIDFGVAKATGPTLTEHTLNTGFGGVVGTPQYMSPEQATFNNLDIDTRSDVYSLGVLLYELLAGSPPFKRKELEKRGLLEILRVVREEEPPKPSTKLSTADALPSLAASRGTEPRKLTGLLRNELDWVVMKALEKDRTRRYETANGFAADVQRYLSGEPVVAHPPTTAYRLRKFVRKNKGPVAAAGVVLLALSLGIAGTTFGLLRAEQKRVEADQATEREATRAAGEQRAKDEAVAEKKKAVEFRDQAINALRATTGEDVQKLIGAKAELTANEKAYLDAIARRWQTFARQEGDDEQSRTVQAEGHARVAYLWAKLGRRAEAKPEYEQAIRIRERLAVDFPSTPRYRHALAHERAELGMLLTHLGQVAEAEREYRAALAVTEKLVAEFPANPEYRSELADVHHSLGHLLAFNGKPTDGEKHLRAGLERLTKLTAEFPAVADYRHSLAIAHNGLGELLARQGDREAAVTEHRRALAIQESLVALLPTTPEYRTNVARTRMTLAGELRKLGRGAEAEEEHRRALAVHQKLAAEFPGVTLYRYYLAGNHSNLGLLLANQGRAAEAEREYRAGLAIQQKLTADFPSEVFARRDLAVTHGGLGALLAGRGRRAEAVEQFRQAIAVWEKLAAEFPDTDVHRVSLGGSYCNLGLVVRDGGQPTDSLEWFRKAIDTLRPVHEKEPRDVTAKQYLRNSHAARAKAYDSLGKHAEAVNDWGRAVELSPKAEQPAHRAARARSHLLAGMVAEAVAEVAELRTLPGWTAAQQYDFACVYAVASGKVVDKKAEYADAAMELLRKAVTAGWKNAAHMKRDTDLDPLRGRDDFKKLLAELEDRYLPKKEVLPPPRRER